MKIAIWSVTRAGGKKGLKIAERFENSAVYSLRKFEIEGTQQIEDFTQSLEREFNRYEAHIFIMATGIVIRKIAPLIKSKDIDPAIIVVDEGLKFAISLLSGHIGGANQLVYELEKRLGVLPIVTTNSDITGKIAVDTLAKTLNGELKSLEEAKRVTALIVDNKEVELKLPKNIGNENPEGVIVVSNKKRLEFTQIYPKNLIIGVGARYGIEMRAIKELLEELLERYNLSEKSIKYFSTVDIKRDEKGIIEIAEFYKRELKIVDREEILKIEEMFEISEFVKQNIGVGAVSEPCAYLSSEKNGKFIVKKAKRNGVTISIYEERDIYEKR